MSEVFDARQVRHAFGRAAQGYEDASALQREIESRLLESFDHYAIRHGDAKPQVVVDLGCGPAHAAAWFRRQLPDARVLAIDAALPMLEIADANTRGQWLRRKPVDRVCADLRALPLADGSVDVLFCNLALQWIDDLPVAFSGFRRVLKPGGLLLCTTFGTDTLYQLREAFAAADAVPHVSPFVDIAGFGDALVAAGFREPVLDRDLLVETLPDFASVLRGLKAMGATNALHARRHSLSGRARFAAADAAYQRNREGGFPLTWEAIYAQAWGPEPGTPIRVPGGELASVPLNRIPIRRR